MKSVAVLAVSGAPRNRGSPGWILDWELAIGRRTARTTLASTDYAVPDDRPPPPIGSVRWAGRSISRVRRRSSDRHLQGPRASKVFIESVQQPILHCQNPDVKQRVFFCVGWPDLWL